jgi:hypothetical protein
MTTQQPQQKREFIEIENDIKNLLISKTRSKKGFTCGLVLNSLLKELKINYSIKLSTFYLFNLLKEDNTKTKQQKRNRIKTLLREIQTHRTNKYFKEEHSVLKYVDVCDYGLNKWGEICLKKIWNIQVLRNYLNYRKKTFLIIEPQ